MATLASLERSISTTAFTKCFKRSIFSLDCTSVEIGAYRGPNSDTSHILRRNLSLLKHGINGCVDTQAWIAGCRGFVPVISVRRCRNKDMKAAYHAIIPRSSSDAREGSRITPSVLVLDQWSVSPPCSDSEVTHPPTSTPIRRYLRPMS